MTLTQITKIRGPGIHTTSNIVSHNINSSGIITAVAFKGPFTGSSDIQSGIVTATKIDLNGDIDVDGHTNLDNVNVAGVATFASAVNTGALTATTGTFSGNVSIGGTLTYEDVTNIDSIGIITAKSGIHLEDYIFHKGDTNTSIGFPSADTVFVKTAGVERFRIDSSGRLQQGSDTSNLGEAKYNIVTGGEDGISLGKAQSGNVSSGDVLGIYAFQSSIGSQSTNSAEASIKGIAAENSSGSTAATHMAFFTKPTGVGPGSSPTEALRITSAGLVGIGTINPGFKLDVDYTNNSEDGIRILNRASGSSSTSMLRLGNDENINAAFLMLNSSGYGSVGGAYNLVLGHGLSRDIVFATAGSERLRIDSSGRVGINTTTLTEQLEVDGDIRVRNQVKYRDPNGDETGAIGMGDDDNFTIQSFGTSGHITFDTGSTAAERLRITNAGNVGINTTSVSRALVIAKDSAASIIELKRTNTNATGTVGVLNFTAMDGHSVANISAIGDGDNEGAHLVFRTTSDAASNDPYNAATVERLRITSGGAISIGKGDEAAAVENLVELYVGGNDTSHATIRGKYNRTNEYNRSEVRFGVENNSAGKGFLAFATGTNSATEKVRITESGDMGLMTIDPQTKLHVQSGSLASGTIMCGGNYNAGGLSNNAAKAGAIHAPHYASDTYPKGFRAYGTYADNGVSMVQIGGGTNDARSATDVRFYASSSATANGTEVGRFNYDGTNTHARFQVDSINNSSAGTKFVVGSGNNVSATVLINTEDTDIDALLLSNWDGSATTNRVFAAFDSSGLGGFKVGMPAATDAFVVKDWGGSEYIHIDATGRLGFKMTPGVWNANNQTVLQLSGTNAGLNLFTRAGGGFLTSNFWYKSDDAGVFQAASGYGLMQLIDAANGQFKFYSSTTTSSSANSSASMIEKFRINPGYSGSTDVKGLPAHLRLYSLRNTSDWDNNDQIGKIDFYVGDDTTNNLPYTTSYIWSVNEADNLNEPSGSLRFGTATANMSGGAIERLRITGAGRVILDDQSGNTDFSDGYAACEIRASGTTKQLVLSNSNTGTTRTSGLWFKVNHSGQDERAKGAIIYASATSDYGRGNMIFCTESTDNNDNADASDERMRIGYTGIIDVPNHSFRPDRGTSNAGGAVLYFSGGKSTTNSAFDMFKLYTVHGNCTMKIEMAFHHSGGGVHGSYTRRYYTLNSYDSLNGRGTFQDSNFGGGGGFTLSRAASPNNTYVTVRYNGSSSFHQNFVLHGRIEHGQSGSANDLYLVKDGLDNLSYTINY